MKIQQVVDSMRINNVGIYVRDGPFSTDIYICYINENYFDSYGCVCPKKLSEFIIKRIGYCLYSEIQYIKYKKVIVFVQVIVYIYFI